jgi:hypothetical protein
VGEGREKYFSSKQTKEQELTLRADREKIKEEPWMLNRKAALL